MNAVHGPSNKEQAEREIKLLFGDLKFDKKGMLYRDWFETIKKKRSLPGFHFIFLFYFCLKQSMNIKKRYKNQK